MTDLEAFLLRNVEDYLFGDLKRITAIGTPNSAGVGYPVVMTAFSGIELFGSLRSTTTFDPDEGRKRFVEFWTQYLYPTVPSSEDLGHALYTLVRNGIAHAFIPQGPIGIAAKTPSVHLQFDPQGRFVINAEQLAEDLMVSYNAAIKSHLTPAGTGIVETNMAMRLREILASPRSANAKSALRKVGTSAPAAAQSYISQSAATSSATMGPSGPSGLSGPAGPVTTTSSPNPP